MAPHAVSRFAASVAAGITRGWTACGRDPSRFPAIAAAEIADGVASGPITASDVIDWVVESDGLPTQARLDETFGQPPVTLYHDTEFQIDALFWMQSSTDIHGHGFGGAFLVLDGRSVHTCYEFVESRRLAEDFSLGRLSAVHAELLDVGDIRVIEPGAALIHSVIHLGHPSVTLVARTCGQGTPEYAYFFPAIAIEPSNADPQRTRILQLIRMLARAGSDRLARTVERVLERCDMYTAFMLLRELSRCPGASALVGPTADMCDRRWPGVGEVFGQAVIADVRHTTAVQLLNRVTDDDHRVVLGAMAALDDPRLIRSFLGAAVERDTERLIGEFVDAVTADGAVTVGRGNPYDHTLLRPLRPRP